MQINTLSTPYAPYRESNPINSPLTPHSNHQEDAKQGNLNTKDTKETGSAHSQDSQSPQVSQLAASSATQEVADKQTQNLTKPDENPHPERITYGLKILELMSDEEYRAFVFASQGLSESQKMLMAQGLYRFTDFYQGRKDTEGASIDATMQQQLKAFGAQNSQIESFITRYKNAYAQILSEGYLG